MGKHGKIALLSLVGGLVGTCFYKIIRQRGIVFSGITIMKVILLAFTLFALFEILFSIKDRLHNDDLVICEKSVVSSDEDWKEFI